MKITVNKNTNRADFMEYIDWLETKNPKFKNCRWGMDTKEQGKNQKFWLEMKDENHVTMFYVEINRFHPIVEQPKPIRPFKDVNGYIVNPLKKYINEKH